MVYFIFAIKPLDSRLCNAAVVFTIVVVQVEEEEAVGVVLL